MKNDYFNTFEESDVKISDELELDKDKGAINILLDCWFDCDKKFGINVLKTDSAWVNMYAEFNPMTEELRVIYDIDTPDKIYTREYVPTDEEIQAFKNVIEQKCENEYAMTCREFCIREYAENHTGKLNLECAEQDGKIMVFNKEDGFILYAEEKGERLENHIGHSVELAAYGNGECISLECADCNEVLYSTDSEEMEFAKEKIVQDKEISDRWKKLFEKAVCYIGEYESGENLYDSLRNEIGATDAEIKEIGFTSLSEYFGQEDEETGMTMQ